jgi:hypothetical protein
MESSNTAIILKNQWCSIKPTTIQWMKKALIWYARITMLLASLTKPKIFKLIQWKILNWFSLWERKVFLSFQKKRILIIIEETQRQIIKAVSFRINMSNISSYLTSKICPHPFMKHFHQRHARNANVFLS